jgi:glyoxylate/hydroxypyruvate reductase A
MARGQVLQMAKTILFATHYPDYVDVGRWVRTMEEGLPSVRVQVWPEVGDPDDIRLVVGDFSPEGFYTSLRNLKCVMYIGAGVDALFRDPHYPKHVPLVRSESDAITFQVAQYVVLQILDHHRHGAAYRTQQAQGVWRPIPTADTRKLTVGILGYGRIGTKSAQALRALEFKVSAWSRTAKAPGPGVALTHGPEGLTQVLGCSDYVVCALPLTPQTRGIVNRQTLAQMKRGVFLINVGRGGHVVDDDLLAALDNGHIAGAALDVFPTEPLPGQHPYWAHPRVTLTPHVANFWVDGSLPQIIDLWHRIESGLPPLNTVDPELGY